MLHPLVYASGQVVIVDQNIQEQPHLETNAHLIFSGQDLLYWVKVQTSVQKISEIAYVSLFDETGKTWFLHKVAINKEGIGSGNFTIPTNAKTGNYKLLTYTSWSKNSKKAAYFSQDLIVINPFIPQREEAKTSNEENPYTITLKDQPTGFTTDNRYINLELNTQTYAPREKVQLNLKAETAALEGNYLLSVRQVPKAQPDQETSTSLLHQKNEDKIYSPEIKGELISGFIQTNNTTVDRSSQLVSLTIPGKNYTFKLTQTNKNGQFIFLLDQPFDTSEATIQVLSESVNYSITVDKNTPKPAEKLSFKKVILDPSLGDWITDQSIDLQIENAYKERVTDTVSDSIQNQRFYDPFATRYTLDDYTRFPSMHETFIEVIELAAMRIDPNQVRIRVYNPNPIIRNELDKLAPLIVVDGIQIQDFSLISNLNPVLVNYIDVVPQQYRYGPKIFGGIIAITTKENDFKLPENTPNTLNFELLSPIKNAEFEAKNYQNSTDFSRIPDYRTQLYWNPEVKVTQQPQQIAFYTSDKQGTFEATLTGYNASGEKVLVKKTFSVTTEQ